MTGGTGFIGSAVILRLAQKGHEVLVLSRSEEAVSGVTPFQENVNVLVSDLSDLKKIKYSLKGFRPDSVIHLAWEGLPDYSQRLCRKNVEMGANFFRLLADMEIKSVLSSGSCWEYEPRREPLTEDSRKDNKSPFSAAKIRLYEEGLEIFRKKSAAFIWLRLFFVYGPGQRSTSLIPYTLECVALGQEPIIKSPGARHDFVYIDDVAECITMALERELPNSVYNVGSGTLTSCGEVAKLALSVAGAEPFEDRPADDTATDESLHYLADTSRTATEVGWTARLSLREGVTRTMESMASLKKKED